MYAPLTNLPPLRSSYDPQLIALSLVVACAAAYASLSLAERITVARGRLRRLWLLAGATAMGSGIWSMHFTGMLALRLSVPVNYNLALVSVSLVVAIAASGIALAAVTRPSFTLGAWVGGGLILGAGICAMHYLLIAAMQLDATPRWNVWIIGFSTLIAVTVSLVGLRLVFQLRALTRIGAERRRLAAALIIGIGLAAMHYIGMRSVTFHFRTTPLATSHVVSATTVGGGVVAILTIMLLGLLRAVAFVDRRFAAQEQALAESKHHFRVVVANAPIILFALDASGTVTLAQGRGLAALGQSSDALMNRSYFDLFADVPDMLFQARSALGGREYTALTKVRDVVLETRWTTVRDEDDRITGAIAVATDITERYSAARALEYQAMHDSLTDLPNRALLKERLLEELRTATSTNGAVALLFIDLNRFKEVNDTFGHQVGDELLVEVGKRVRAVLGPADLVARLGGDEFAVVLARAAIPEARAGALRVLAKLGGPLILEGHDLQLGASLGIAVYPDHGSDVLTLMRNADIAMYVAKRAGGGFAVYDPTRDLPEPERFPTGTDPRQVVGADDLRPAVQAKARLAAGQGSDVQT